MPSRPNVILLILDACRRDALDPYSRRLAGEGPATPVLKKLADQGVAMEDCQSTSACTAISVSSILTGVGPHRHGVTTLVGAALREGVDSVGAQLRHAGYVTGFFPSSAVLNRMTRIGEAFHYVDDGFLEPLYRDCAGGGELDLPLFRRHFYQPPATRTVPGSMRFCEVTTEALLAWMVRTPDPFLAVVHLIEPHYPYWPPPEWRVSADPLDQKNYHASLRYVDAVCVERVVDVLQRRGSETLLIVTSDHGEYWGTHGFRPTGDHGDLYQDVLAVPLIVWGAGTERLRPARAAPWSHLDVAPTILGLLGVPAPPSLEGINRSASEEERPRPSWEDAAFNDPGYVAAMGGFRRGGVAVRMGRYKLIRRAPGLGEPELYDLDTDPDEKRSLVDIRPDVLRTVSVLLPPAIAYAGSPAPDLRHRLAALGYL